VLLQFGYANRTPSVENHQSSINCGRIFRVRREPGPSTIRHGGSWTTALLSSGAANRLPDTTPGILIAWLPVLLPVLHAYHMGADLVVNEGNFEWAAVADFDDLEGYLTYRDNPEHRAIIAEFVRLVAERAAIQYEF
jgi:Stress responsive A/B Barrel Domain